MATWEQKTHKVHRKRQTHFGHAISIMMSRSDGDEKKQPGHAIADAHTQQRTVEITQATYAAHIKIGARQLNVHREPWEMSSHFGTCIFICFMPSLI